MDGETMISLFENLSTRDEAFTMVEIFLLNSQSRKLKRDIKEGYNSFKAQTISNKVYMHCNLHKYVSITRKLF